MKNKLIKVGSGVLLGMTLLSTTAFAHHGNGGYHRGTGYKGTGYAVCSYSNCTLKTTHRHNGTYYYAHHKNDGHYYHR